MAAAGRPHVRGELLQLGGVAAPPAEGADEIHGIFTRERDDGQQHEAPIA
jgi:hypothetical protein